MNDIQKLLIKCDKAMDMAFELNRLNECLYTFIQEQGLQSQWVAFAKDKGYISGSIRVKPQFEETQPNNFTA